MLDSVQPLLAEHAALQEQLSDSAVHANQALAKKLNRRYAELSAIVATYDQVNARLQALRFKSNQDEEKWKSAVKEHEQMIDALAKRDASALQAVLLQHLHNKRDVVMAQLQAQRSAAPSRTA